MSMNKLCLKNIKSKLMLKLAFLIAVSMTFTTSVYSVREARPTPLDSRIRVLVYSPDDVFKFVGYYGYQASIELSKTEEVLNVSMGDTTAWQVVPSGNRIFIKPTDYDATTNMTIITNKRTYFFELYADSAIDIRDPEMAFNIRFIYPDEQAEDDTKIYNASNSANEPDLQHPERYNFAYMISGDESIAPIKIFDNGEFTYMQFRDKNAEIPSIFAVEDDLRESMVNYHVSQNNPNMIIIEQVFYKLSIRLGKRIVCVFNEKYTNSSK